MGTLNKERLGEESRLVFGWALTTGSISFFCKPTDGTPVRWSRGVPPMAENGMRRAACLIHCHGRHPRFC